MFYSTKVAYEEAKKSLRGIRNIEIIKSDVKVKEDVDKLIYKVFKDTFRVTCRQSESPSKLPIGKINLIINYFFFLYF